MKSFFAQKHPPLAKQFGNVGVRVENVLAGQVRQTRFICEPAMVIDRRQDRKVAFHSQHVVVGAMTGSDVYGASSRVHRDESGREHRDFAIQKWMACLDSFKISSGK